MRAILVILAAFAVACSSSTAPKVFVLPVQYAVGALPSDSPQVNIAVAVGGTGQINVTGKWVTAPDCGYNPSFGAFIVDSSIQIHLYPTTIFPNPVCAPAQVGFLWAVETDTLRPATYRVQVLYPYIANSEVIIATDTVVVH